MKPKELKQFLVEYFGRNPKEVPPLIIWGPPGVGKSDIVGQAAAKAFMNSQVESKLRDGNIDIDSFVKTVYLTLCDPTDLKGLPAIKGDTAVWLPPSQLPKEDRDARRGVVFLDELPSAVPAVQVTCHRLILERSIEEYKLPDGWHVIAAGNRRTDKALVYEMQAPLANRFIHLELEPDLNSWKEWAYNHEIDSRVISFLNWRPSLLLDMDAARNSNAFPSPRSWVSVSKILEMGDGENTLELIRGAVGDGAATEFIGFLNVHQNLPDIDEIMDGKDVVPQETSELYALCGAIAERYKQDPQKHAGRVIECSHKLPAEFSVLLVRDAIRIDNSITQTREWKEWAKVHSDIVL